MKKRDCISKGDDNDDDISSKDSVSDPTPKGFVQDAGEGIPSPARKNVYKFLVRRLIRLVLSRTRDIYKVVCEAYNRVMGQTFLAMVVKWHSLKKWEKKSQQCVKKDYVRLINKMAERDPHKYILHKGLCEILKELTKSKVPAIHEENRDIYRDTIYQLYRHLSLRLNIPVDETMQPVKGKTL